MSDADSIPAEEIGRAHGAIRFFTQTKMAERAFLIHSVP